jgi:predicted  nucleic acid-binding Zn-ribbon protein
MTHASKMDTELKEIRHRRERYELRIIEVEARLKKLRNKLQEIITEEKNIASGHDKSDSGS